MCTEPGVTGGYRFLWPLSVVAVAAALLLPGARQPLLENFIDRQCHTAMIARNLSRGGSVFYPEIDVGPFPAYYMLEWPLYPALVAALHRLTALPLDALGRLVSAACIIGSVLLLFGLLNRGTGAAAAAFGTLLAATAPVVVRYGRAFQPDALLMLCLLAAVRCAELAARSSRRRWTEASAWGLAAVAIVLKGTVLWVVLVVGALLWGRGVRRVLLGAVVAVAPAGLWYSHAVRVAVAGGANVSADFWAVEKWLPLERLGGVAWVSDLAYYVGWRTLGPVLLAAAVGGVVWAGARALPRWARWWAVGLVVWLPVLVRKVDHEHYYLVLVPVAAAAAAVLAERASGWRVRGRVVVLGCTVASVVLGAAVAIRTRRVPAEWRDVLPLAAEVQRVTRRDELVVASAAVLFYADRRGYAVAHRPADVRQWVAKWGGGGGERVDRPEELLGFYAARGAAVVAELEASVRLVPGGNDYLRWLRRSHVVLVDRPGRYVVARVGAGAAGAIQMSVQCGRAEGEKRAGGGLFAVGTRVAW